MKLVIAVVAAMSACACATTSNGNANGAARVAATGAKQYCVEGSLASAGGRHNCTWSTDKAAACDTTTFTTIEASGYTSPRSSSKCPNGRWLVEMSPLS